MKVHADVIVIGAGACGAAVLRELSYIQGLRVICLEKDTDVSNATTKANSGIVHAGYDPLPGTKMAYYNVRGNEIIRTLAKQLDIPFKQCGSMVVAFDDEDCQTLSNLMERGRENGVPDLQMLDAGELYGREPSLSPGMKGALYAPTAGVIDSWQLAIAQVDVAVQNGAAVYLETEVKGIRKETGCFLVTASRHGEEMLFESDYIVNAAGVHAGQISRMMGQVPFREAPNKGQYLLLDKSQGTLAHSVIFQCPSKEGKGVLVAPTVHGNLIVGPDSQLVDDPEDVSTDADRLAFIRSMAARTCDRVDYRETIRTFAGVRAQSDLDEFLIAPLSGEGRFIQVANIKSPGLTASPAIALDVVGMLGKAGLPLSQKRHRVTKRKIARLRDCDEAGKRKLIQENPAFGRMICRCETVSEAEIVNAIHSPLPAVTVEAVKRRCNAGMGRCQGGFCAPRVVELICRETGMKPEQVLMDHAGSYLLTGPTPKGVRQNEPV